MTEGRASRRFLVIAALSIFGTSFVADFLHLRQFGLLADDWAILGNLVWGKLRPASRVIHDIFFRSWEARPLRAVEYALLLAGERCFGLAGAFATLWAAIASTGLVFAALARRRLPAPPALLFGLLVVLHPADTTHVWAATLMAKLGVLYTALACGAFCRDRSFFAYAGCTAALFSYELAVFPFVLAPWFRDGGSRRSMARAALTMALAFATYGIWRKLEFPRLVPDARAAAAFGRTADLHGLVDAWLGAAAAAIPGAILRWPAQAVAVACGPGFRAPTLVASSFLAVAGLALARKRPPSAEKVAAPTLLRAGAFGLATIVAGSALAFYARPNLSIDMTSRHNLAVIPGAALVLTVLIAALAGLCRRAATRDALILATALLLGSFVGFRLAVQQGWIDAWRYQRGVLRQTIDDLGPLPPRTAVLIGGALHSWQPVAPEAMRPFVIGAAFESEAIFGLVYDPSIFAGIVETDEDGRLLELMSAFSQFRRERETGGLLVHESLLYEVPSRRIRWWEPRRPADPRERPIPPSGPAWDLIRGEDP